MRNFRRLFGACLVLLSTIGAIPAKAGTGVDALNRFLDGMDTFDARFEQTVYTENGGVQGPVGGHLYVARPGRFRWDYDGESGQLVVADGKRVWLLDRDLEQVSHQSQESALRGTPAQLLVGGEAVDTYFSVAEGDSFEGLTWVDLTPKDEESQFHLLRVGFSGDTLARIEMADKFGQYTSFELTEVQRNAALDDKLFVFEPPPGWDVFQTH